MLSIIIVVLNLLIETSVSLTVKVPPDPIVSHVGSTVILPCWISPPENAEALEIRWYRNNQFSNPVLLFNYGKIQDIQEESYRNRSSLTPRSDHSGGLKDGDVSLRLEKLTIQDEDSFHCYVSGEHSYGSEEVVLKITALGSSPVLSPKPLDDGRVNISCRSSGWYPEPSITWTSDEGRTLHPGGTSHSRGADKMFSVHSWTAVSLSDAQLVSCSVSLRSGELKEGRLNIQGIVSSVSLTVKVPPDPVVSHVGSTVTLPCWISPPESAEALEIRWYRNNQFNNPVLLYNHGKIQEVQECFRNRSSLTPRSDQSGGLKDGDVSLRLEKLSYQDEDLFHCHVSGESSYDSKVVDLKITDPSDSSDSSGPWKALFLTFLICALLGLFGFILYRYREKLTGKKPATEICEEETLERLTKEVVGDINVEELRKHAVEITIDREHSHPDLTVSKDCKILRDSKEYHHTAEEFPFQLCAFGAQRFSSGRHYWEVELVQTNRPPKTFWIIGVVKHGNFTTKDRSALTPSRGFWFLCSDGPRGFYTSTDPSIRFSLTPRPERLGVLFDYDDGQLSFYNVTERRHLLTISSRFSGSVVPLFNPGAGDKSAITILDCPKPVEPAESSDNLL